MQQSAPPLAQGGSAPFLLLKSTAHLGQWLAEREARGEICTVSKSASRTQQPTSPFTQVINRKKTKRARIWHRRKLAQIQKRIDFIVESLERAIANHEFEKARSFSSEERKERENLRSLREQFNLEEPTSRVPLLSIDIISDERFSEVQKRCDDYISEGVTQVWLLGPNLKARLHSHQNRRLPQFRGGILQIANPPLEIDLREDL